VYNIFDVCGEVGGISTVFMGITAFLLAPYCEQSFKLNAIQELFEIKYRKKLKKLNFLEKIGQFTHINPISSYSRLLK
jgi:hypothetical protein